MEYSVDMELKMCPACCRTDLMELVNRNPTGRYTVTVNGDYVRVRGEVNRSWLMETLCRNGAHHELKSLVLNAAPAPAPDPVPCPPQPPYLPYAVYQPPPPPPHLPPPVYDHHGVPLSCYVDAHGNQIYHPAAASDQSCSIM